MILSICISYTVPLIIFDKKRDPGLLQNLEIDRFIFTDN